jgi:hypothetical protein
VQACEHVAVRDAPRAHEQRFLEVLAVDDLLRSRCPSRSGFMLSKWLSPPYTKRVSCSRALPSRLPRVKKLALRVAELHDRPRRGRRKPATTASMPRTERVPVAYMPLEPPAFVGQAVPAAGDQGAPSEPRADVLRAEALLEDDHEVERPSRASNVATLAVQRRQLVGHEVLGRDGRHRTRGPRRSTAWSLSSAP